MILAIPVIQAKELSKYKNNKKSSCIISIIFTNLSNVNIVPFLKLPLPCAFEEKKNENHNFVLEALNAPCMCTNAHARFFPPSNDMNHFQGTTILTAQLTRF